jgi:serine/threonine protein kinase
MHIQTDRRIQTTIIASRYQIDEPIGAGGMASVYLATDLRLGRRVALKVLSAAHADHPEFIERFRREARAAARIDHPSVVPVYDWGDDGGTHYIVMGYVLGPDLKQVLRERGPLPEHEALSIARDVAAALDAAHRQGVIHRDIKPHNILIDPDGQPRVTDFGIAQAAGLAGLTETSVVIGTATYISPEQASRQDVDARTDIYSLGIVLYEMLAGQPPFMGDSMVALAMQHVNEQPTLLRQLRHDVSAATERAVMRAIEKDPSARYPSAESFRDALDEAMGIVSSVDATATAETLPIAATPASATAPTVARQRPVPKWTARPAGRRSWMPAFVLLIAGLVALLAFLITQFIDTPDETDTTAPDSGNGVVATDDATPEAESDEPGAGAVEEAQTEEPPAVEESTPAADSATPEPASEPESPDESAPESPDAEEESTAALLPLGDVTCIESIGPAVIDSLLVPSGSVCQLSGTTVREDVDVEPGGMLVAIDVQFLDDLDVDSGAVELAGQSFVDGNVTVERGGRIVITGTHVTGNIQLTSNVGPLMIEGNVIDGDLQAYDNTGAMTIVGNQVAGNLQCDGNDPPPSGSSNVVGGNMEDQCAGF